MKTHYRFLYFLLVSTIFLTHCSDDDTDPPMIQVTSGDLVSVKPGESTTITMQVISDDGLAADAVSVSLSGDGAATVLMQPEPGSTDATVEVEFQASANPDQEVTLTVEVIDQESQVSQVVVSISVTSLDFPLVWVINEGNFFSANGSISSFDLLTEEVTQGIYEASATIQNVSVSASGSVYLIGNAPDKMDILDASLRLSASISTDLSNPIDVSISAASNRAYITNWGDISTAFSDNPDSYLAVIDLTSNTLVETISLDQRPQDIELIDGALFIAHEATSFLTVIDTEDNAISTLATPFGPSEFVTDAEGDLWALCTSGNLIEIDPNSKTVVRTLGDLTTSGFNEKMAINENEGIIYFLGQGNSGFTGQTTVYEVDISQGDLDATEFISNGVSLYGIAVNPENGNVLVGDNNAFQSTGTAFIYNSDGEQLTTFATGVGPNDFIFP